MSRNIFSAIILTTIFILSCEVEPVGHGEVSGSLQIEILPLSSTKAIIDGSGTAEIMKGSLGLMLTKKFIQNVGWGSVYEHGIDATAGAAVPSNVETNNIRFSNRTGGAWVERPRDGFNNAQSVLLGPNFAELYVYFPFMDGISPVTNATDVAVKFPYKIPITLASGEDSIDVDYMYWPDPESSISDKQLLRETDSNNGQKIITLAHALAKVSFAIYLDKSYYLDANVKYANLTRFEIFNKDATFALIRTSNPREATPETFPPFHMNLRTGELTDGAVYGSLVRENKDVEGFRKPLRKISARQTDDTLPLTNELIGENRYSILLPPNTGIPANSVTVKLTVDTFVYTFDLPASEGDGEGWIKGQNSVYKVRLGSTDYAIDKLHVEEWGVASIPKVPIQQPAAL